MHFTLRQMQAFVAVASTGSFSRASEYLCLSSSAVSQLVIELEAVLGYKLFERSTRKVTLSPAGSTLIPSAQALLRQLESTKLVASDIRDQAAGLVRIAAPLVIASTLLPRMLVPFRQLRPKTTVRVIDCPVEELVGKVAMRQVDLAIGPDRPTGPDVQRIPLYPSPWVIWCAPTHRLAKFRTIRWKDLPRFELVTAGRDHEIHLATMTRHMSENEKLPAPQVVDNITTALGLAASGLYYTLSPDYVEPLALSLGLVMRRIEDPVLTREVSLFCPADRALSPAANAFAEHLEAALRPAG